MWEPIYLLSEEKKLPTNFQGAATLFIDLRINIATMRTPLEQWLWGQNDKHLKLFFVSKSDTGDFKTRQEPY